MKILNPQRIFILLLVLSLPFFSFANGSDSLGQSVNITKAGLNYVTASKRLTQRFVPEGDVQPAKFTISGIPANAKIEQAFVWISTSGNGAAISVTVKNPANATSSFPMQVIGSGIDKCWGYQGSYSYRADVTSAVNGNGDYMISGLPVGYPNDVDGATLMIIYSDPDASYTGHIVINDGAIVRLGLDASASVAINATENSTLARAFTGIGDLQFNTTIISMNNGPAQTVDWNFWNFDKRTTSIHAGQANANFTVSAPTDCYNWVLAGIYYQTGGKNNGGPTISIVNNFTVDESNKFALVPVMLNGFSNKIVRVRYSTSDITAMHPDDYTEVKFLTLFFPKFNKIAYAIVPINQDSTMEGDETFRITLSNPVNATLMDSVCIVTIKDAASLTTLKQAGSTNAGLAANESQAFKIAAYPNPAKQNFTIQLNSGDVKTAVSLSIFNSNGKLVETKQNVSPGKSIILGESYSPGVYFLHAVQGDKKIVMKLVKIGN